MLARHHMTHAFNLCIWEAEAKNPELKVRLRYIHICVWIQKKKL